MFGLGTIINVAAIIVGGGIGLLGGSTAGMDFGYDYIKMMAQGFYGIPQVECVKAENLDIYGADVKGFWRCYRV